MGELIDKKTSVSIDGRRLFAFKSFKLKQSLNTHHCFELVINRRQPVCARLERPCCVAGKASDTVHLIGEKADSLKCDHIFQ